MRQINVFTVHRVFLALVNAALIGGDAKGVVVPRPAVLSGRQFVCSEKYFALCGTTTCMKNLYCVLNCSLLNLADVLQ